MDAVIYAIEASTALPNWTSANLTVTNHSGAVTFPAPDATYGAQRFYRLRIYEP